MQRKGKERGKRGEKKKIRVLEKEERERWRKERRRDESEGEKSTWRKGEDTRKERKK